MRTKEGVGKVPPLPVRVQLTEEDLSLARTHTRQRLRQRGYAYRQDEWGYGILGPVRSVYVGFVGEIAFSKWVRATLGIDSPVDTSYRRRGDGGIDFIICGYGVQVKAATTDYDDLLIRTQDACAAADAENSPVEWDVCFRLHWPPRRGRSSGAGGLFDDGRRCDQLAVDICGLVWGVDFLRLSHIEPSHCGDHWNYAVRPSDFLPPSTFLDKCRARLMRKERDAN